MATAANTRNAFRFNRFEGGLATYSRVAPVAPIDSITVSGRGQSYCVSGRTDRRPAHITNREFSLAQVKADSTLSAAVSAQAACIRADVAGTGSAQWAGRGHRPALTGARAFAVRVLLAQGELVLDPSDNRRYVAA